MASQAVLDKLRYELRSYVNTTEGKAVAGQAVSIAQLAAVLPTLGKLMAEAFVDPGSVHVGQPVGETDDDEEKYPALTIPRVDQDELTDVQKLYVSSKVPRIIGMDRARAAIAMTMTTTDKILPSIFEGHTGLAKTQLLAMVHAEAGWPYRTVAGHGNVEADMWVGKMGLVDGNTKFIMGILPFCMKHGIALGVQEINAVPPEVLIMFHEFLDEGQITLHDLGPEHEDFVVRPHPLFRLYGTMNPPEFYPGTRYLSPALKRRSIIVQVDPPDSEVEVLAIRSSVPDADEALVQRIVKMAGEVRQAQDKEAGQFFLSPADLVMMAEFSLRMPPFEAAQLAILGKVPYEDRANVEKHIRLTFAPDDNWSFSAPLAEVEAEISE